jgi:hypothetical protein
MSDRTDFDLLHGHWRVRNRRLTDRADPACEAWEAFEATAEVRPVLGGLGHVDHFVAPRLPDGAPFEGLTLRLFDPAAALWRIWWAATARPGRLDPPLAGRFADGVGRFDGEDVVGGRAVRLRFLWKLTATPGPRWEQAFSWDDGATWTTNWTMDLVAAPA